MDMNGDGQLTIEELQAGLKNIQGIKINEKDLINAMKVMDANQNGLIDYSEFIAACMQSYNYLQDAQLRAAFAYFDKDGSGAITKEELRTCLQSEEFTMTEEEIQKLLSGVDANGDEQIDYIEFITMMKSI